MTKNPKQSSIKKAAAPRLDTILKLVGDDKQKSKGNYRIQIAQMKEFSGSVLCTERDYQRGYTSTSLCGKHQISNKENVPLIKSTNGNHYFGGLKKCGSVWRCPVCSYKISQAKQKQISFLTKSLSDNDFKTSFVTLTLRHKKSDLLVRRLDDLLSEFRKFQSTSVYKKLKKNNNIIGIVKTTEITYSKKNGWHPHLHLLIYHTSDTVNLFHKELIKNWIKRKKIGGLVRANKAILVNSENEKVSNYLAKWNISNELASSTKLAKKDSYTPFQILKKLTFNQFEKDETKRELYSLYYNYSHATAGRHFVSISRNLTKHLDFEQLEKYNKLNKTDKEILEDDKKAEVITFFTPFLWSFIISQKDSILYKKIIIAYEKDKIQGILNLLNKYENINPLYDKKNNVFYTKNKKKLNELLIKPKLINTKSIYEQQLKMIKDGI